MDRGVGSAARLNREGSLERTDPVDEALKTLPAAGTVPPRPSSLTSMIRRPLRGAIETEAEWACAYLAMFASASETTKYAALSICSGSARRRSGR